MRLQKALKVLSIWGGYAVGALIRTIAIAFMLTVVPFVTVLGARGSLLDKYEDIAPVFQHPQTQTCAAVLFFLVWGIQVFFLILDHKATSSAQSVKQRWLKL